MAGAIAVIRRLEISSAQLECVITVAAASALSAMATRNLLRTSCDRGPPAGSSLHVRTATM
jgi:hypothetical protein